MTKRIFCLALVFMFLLGVMMQQVTAIEENLSAENQVISADETSAEIPDCEEVAASEEHIAQNDAAMQPTGPRIFVDGVEIEHTYSNVYQQTTYASLRSIAQALRPDAEIAWTGSYATISAEDLSITVYPKQSYFVANGRYLYLPYGVHNENGSLLLPVRTLAKCFDAEVEWDSETKCVNIFSGTGSIVSGEAFYNSDDLYWLSHIIHAESEDEPFNGKIAVGNVILNRVDNPAFPDTIYGVIHQKNQFSPVASGRINLHPNEDSVIAAKLCLDGAVILSDALWFNRAGVSCWASKHKTCIATIGAHAFYA